MDARTIYARLSFARMCAEAGVRENYTEPVEDVLTKAFSRLCAIDSRRWIAFLLDILPRQGDVNFSADAVLGRLYALAESPVMLGELIELLGYKLNTIDFIDTPADLPYDCPLDEHCSYTRDQLLLALDFMKPKTLREGVKWLNDKQTDVLLITLNKSYKEYSPTGQRYINHKTRGSHVLLFVRETKSDVCGTALYTFLGTADYVSHSGSRPMSIVWQLHQEIPVKFLRKTQQVME